MGEQSPVAEFVEPAVQRVKGPGRRQEDLALADACVAIDLRGIQGAECDPNRLALFRPSDDGQSRSVKLVVRRPVRVGIDVALVRQ